jgi:hypothetical protein
MTSHSFPTAGPHVAITITETQILNWSSASGKQASHWPRTSANKEFERICGAQPRFSSPDGALKEKEMASIQWKRFVFSFTSRLE